MTGLRVERAAILWKGVAYSVPRPGRHHDVIYMMVRLGLQKPIRGEQGFVLSDGRFVLRLAALQVARKAGQIIKEHAPAHGLFSEDLW